MAAAWNVLVVDDEADIHSITKLALRRKTWRDRPIAITSAKSGAEARAILEKKDGPSFHCALVDVVMETDDAGLKLCDFIRATVPRTTRIILRTGQPGAAPPEKVMNDYDIDYYLAKTEVTEDRLFMTLRACLRSSLDIAAMIALDRQLRALTAALREVSTTPATLASITREALRFLEEKYSAAIAFVGDASATSDADVQPFGAAAIDAVTAAHAQRLPPMTLQSAEPFGLGPGTFIVIATPLPAIDRSEKTVSEKLKSWFQGLVKESEKSGAGGIILKFEKEHPQKILDELTQELELFVSNWRVADGTLRLQDRIVRERVGMMKMPSGSP
jgi:CheY-like chemotaxis protein